MSNFCYFHGHTGPGDCPQCAQQLAHYVATMAAEVVSTARPVHAPAPVPSSAVNSTGSKKPTYDELLVLCKNLAEALEAYEECWTNRTVAATALRAYRSRIND